MEIHKTADPNGWGQKTEPYPLSIGVDPTALKGIPRPDLNGKRIQDPEDNPHGAGAIYLIDEGMKRWIPNPGTYDNLFRDGSGVIVDSKLAKEIPEMTPLSDGAILAMPAYYQSIWLIDNHQKRHVTSPAVMDKYHFAGGRIYQIPPILLEYIPPGNSIY